ncbi:uncharacterized protein LOC141528254 isoform X2 [Cotesia typhae]|uniref:uncharacterized protein LOC141528254 isoform X2 n=1 Tax=Cotesia typhae TaxID=2053667 RepID=UPI003D696FCC
MHHQLSDESTDEEEVTRGFDAEAQLIVQTDTLPKKSADKYTLVYNTYKKWKQKNKSALSDSEENNLIVYFKSLSTKLCPSTLWSIHSMLKSTLNARDNIDISKFYKLKSLVKNNAKGHKPKKSAILTWDEVMAFINNAPDYTHLANKVMLIFGICGATRCDELKELQVADIEEINDFGTERFFVQFSNGKCCRQVIGRNKIGQIPKIIAEYLKLTDPQKYTGHCLRRTSATLISNSGASVTMLKQLGRWKSATIAEAYVENSLLNRQNIFDKITHAAKVAHPSDTNPQPSTSETNSTQTKSSVQTHESISTETDCDNLFDDFCLDDDTLTAIDNSFESEKPVSLLPSFTTANNKKIIINSAVETAEPCHFLKKPPISVFSHDKENQPPEKKMKVEQIRNANSNVKSASTSTNFVTSRQKFKSTPNKNHTRQLTSETKLIDEAPESASIEALSNKNPNIRYDNCTFHGKIINNFYISDDKLPEPNI